MQPYPKFILHGEKGSFIKQNIDQQETCLKAGNYRGRQGLGQETEYGALKYLDKHRGKPSPNVLMRATALWTRLRCRVCHVMSGGTAVCVCSGCDDHHGNSAPCI